MCSAFVVCDRIKNSKCAPKKIMYGRPQICGYRINLVDLKADRFCGFTDQSVSHVLDYVRHGSKPDNFVISHEMHKLTF